MDVGYARTSTFDQQAGIEAQMRDLGAVPCQRIFSEQVSSVAARAQLDAVLDFVREGDTLVVTRLDRLARSTADLLGILTRLDRKGVSLRVLDFGGSAVDTQSPTGKLMLTMFGALAEWERSLMICRQREGIEKAKALGRYKGRVPTARRQAAEVSRLAREGLRAPLIADRLSISRASVYRLLAEERRNG